MPVVAVGSVTVFDEGGPMEGSLMNPGIEGNGRGGGIVVAVVSPIFTTPAHSSTTTEGGCGGLECDDDVECSYVIGDLDQAPISNRVKLAPKRTREWEVLRDNEGIRGRFEENWNSSSYSCWESGWNEELGTTRNERKLI